MATRLTQTGEEVQDILNKSAQAILVTYEELKAKRDAGILIPGAYYRITDFVTTVNMEDIRSAGHAFDLIVLALSPFELSEKAFAQPHEDDTYFADANLSAWQLWYTLDNDKTRFDWADEDNGKGVIYRMIDEWGNDCSYDFKNIQMHRTVAASFGWFYAFAADGIAEVDGSLSGAFEDNFLQSMITIWGGRGYRNKVLTNWDLSLTINGHDNSIDSAVAGLNSDSIVFGSYNRIDGRCANVRIYGSSNLVYSSTNIRLGNIDVDTNVSYTVVLPHCDSILVGNYCRNNRFGSDCRKLTIGDKSNYNVFDSGCSDIELGEYSDSNVFGPNCKYITAGNYTLYNVFGPSCQYISAGNFFEYNSFGSGCYSIKCLDTDTNKERDNVHQCHFSSHTRFMVIQKPGWDVIKNYRTAQGLMGSDDSPLIIDAEADRAYETMVAKDSLGHVKQFCIADIIL